MTKQRRAELVAVQQGFAVAGGDRASRLRGEAHHWHARMS